MRGRGRRVNSRQTRRRLFARLAQPGCGELGEDRILETAARQQDLLNSNLLRLLQDQRRQGVMEPRRP